MIESTFYSVLDALRAGYQLERLTTFGYLARQRTADGWIFANVVIAA